ncbi:MAG: hypothetical protein V1831_01020 [Candidatus Woesearchaeota archaeon]
MRKKAQAWFMDFVIALIIFIFILIAYYTYTANISKQDSSAMDNLISDSKTIVSSLTTGGYPDNWNSNNVVRIGFTDNYNRINNDQFIEFNEINYNRTKKLLGTTYDYLLFFVNESNDVQNIEGFCGTGSGLVNITYDVSAAYYYKDETYLKQFMIDNFDAGVYCENSDDCPLGNMDTLIANINNYGVIVMEAPEFPTSKYNDIKDPIEAWVLGGGFFMQSGRPFAADKREMLGVEFNKVTGDAGKDKPATVLRNDEIISFEYGENIIFKQVYYIEDVSIGANLVDIARFNESDVEIADIMDNKIALARWLYGSGKVIFFSDFDAAYLAEDFQDILEASTKRWIGAMCLPINIANINRKDLVKLDRLLIYNSDQVKMVFYLWE